MKYKMLCIALSLLFTGCLSVPTLKERHAKLMEMNSKEAYKSVPIETSSFTLFLLQSNFTCKDKTMHVYIEGDGLAWKTRTLISDDPTPTNPTAFSLMNQDSFTCKVYIARPCQYIHTSLCNEKYWTSHRFSKEVIESFDEALDNLKQKYGVKDFWLIGYSGGAAVASLVANQRNDVDMLISVAGNLNTKLWTKTKNISPLYGSLNPSDFTNNLQDIKQYHLIGKSDTIMPKEIAFSYINNFSNKNNITYKMVDTTHSCCWEQPFKETIEGLK